ncbi:MAG: GNAT family N-acetyltransferase [Clostridia bacterium]|nr:GNAT family N-acetyltransferase [Clostridia bacterium]
MKFLQRVDAGFPVPLSNKTTLEALAQKFCDKATLCYELDGEDIVYLVAGYTDNVVDNVAYISVVATLDRARGKGFATKCVSRFLEIAERKGLHATHLYTDRKNEAAINMYLKIGFVPWVVENELRPNDIHLIYYFKGD